MYSEEKPFRSPLCLNSTFWASSDWFWQSSRVQLSWQPRATAHCLHRRLLWLWPVLVSAGGFCCAAAVKRGSEREPLTPPPRPARPSCCSGPQRTPPKAQTETSSFPTATPKRREVMLGGPPTPVFCKTCPRELTQCAGMPRPMYSVQAARLTALGMALLKHALVPAREKDLSHALNPSHEASLTCYSWKSSREQIRRPEAEETVYRVWP